jgi:fibronectin type 3 domain-containing protein
VGSSSSDFDIEFNDDGSWCDALVKSSHDANNVRLTWQDENTGSWHITNASRGDEPGQFRSK